MSTPITNITGDQTPTPTPDPIPSQHQVAVRELDQVRDNLSFNLSYSYRTSLIGVVNERYLHQLTEARDALRVASQLFEDLAQQALSDLPANE
ncbi:MAG: hypothetical protein GY701_22880 [Sulfitobacter sp.]|nr:hypothetical protein [Sulfitobacter sp.]